MIEYRIARKDEISRVYSLREQVFVIEQGVPIELELDEFDDCATHVVAIEGNSLLACGRLVNMDNHMKIGRVAVRQEFRSKGIGLRLMVYLIKLAETADKPIKLDSQLEATGFYNKLGFVEEGDVFMDAGIQHIKMIYRGRVK